ncbi:protein NipSnap homolog 3A isoform X5 [Piliocolobus tephrosceles]|uniref:protein NipSnap homolog 3A isoform X5 n=1 Tax=Piliocolobus tephrosceles TaxID=591936 RepID=UPI000E6B0175|nr:protein NipSnap homolog 3A isoform X5 [Piliocolobus tephrosceles]
MLVLRSGLTRALASRTLAPQVCSSFATGPRQYDGTFYEFRTYYLKPSKMNAFMENLKKTIHLRTAHSELVGFWSIEFGGRMNKVFHIWKYVHVLWWNESADSRAAGRHKSHEDPRVVAAVRESVNYLVSQQNMLLIPTSFSPLK